MSRAGAGMRRRLVHGGGVVEVQLGVVGGTQRGAHEDGVRLPGEGGAQDSRRELGEALPDCFRDGQRPERGESGRANL